MKSYSIDDNYKLDVVSFEKLFNENIGLKLPLSSKRKYNDNIINTEIKYSKNIDINMTVNTSSEDLLSIHDITKSLLTSMLVKGFFNSLTVPEKEIPKDFINKIDKYKIEYLVSDILYFYKDIENKKEKCISVIPIEIVFKK